jgi:hypothetical protein
MPVFDRRCDAWDQAAAASLAHRRAGRSRIDAPGQFVY